MYSYIIITHVSLLGGELLKDTVIFLCSTSQCLVRNLGQHSTQRLCVGWMNGWINAFTSNEGDH